MKKIRSITMMMTAVALALGVQAAGPVPVYGSTSFVKPAGSKTDGLDLEVTEETEIVVPVGYGDQKVKSELLGTIDVALISVTMPADGFEFQVDPEAYFHAVTDPGGQIMCPDPDMLQITNNSVVPVQVEISGVQDIGEGDISFSEAYDGGAAEQSFHLVRKISEVNQAGTAILVLGKAGQRYTSDSDFEQYAIYPGRTGIRVADLKAGESAGLQLYGKAAADFYGEYQFTVRPTLKISAVGAR